jgi:uncharacterized protein (TIGR02246 family)
MTFGSRTRWGMPLLLSLAMGTAGVAGAQGVEAPRVPLRTALAEINSKRAEYQQTYNSKDVDAVAALYTADAVVVGADGQIYNGRPAIHAMLADQLKGSPASMTLAATSTKVYGNTAVEVGTVTTSGGDAAPMTMHYLVVLRRDMHGWNLTSASNVPESAKH